MCEKMPGKIKSGCQYHLVPDQFVPFCHNEFALHRGDWSVAAADVCGNFILIGPNRSLRRLRANGSCCQGEIGFVMKIKRMTRNRAFLTFKFLIKNLSISPAANVCEGWAGTSKPIYKPACKRQRHDWMRSEISGAAVTCHVAFKGILKFWRAAILKRTLVVLSPRLLCVKCGFFGLPGGK